MYGKHKTDKTIGYKIQMITDDSPISWSLIQKEKTFPPFNCWEINVWRPTPYLRIDLWNSWETGDEPCLNQDKAPNKSTKHMEHEQHQQTDAQTNKRSSSVHVVVGLTSNWTIKLRKQSLNFKSLDPSAEPDGAGRHFALIPQSFPLLIALAYQELKWAQVRATKSSGWEKEAAAGRRGF